MVDRAYGCAPGAFRGPMAYELASSIPEIADVLHRLLCELSTHPTSEGAEETVVTLDGARRAVLRLQAALIREGEGHGA